MRIAKILLLPLICLMVCSGCGHNEADTQEKVKSQTEGTKEAAEDTAQGKGDMDSRTDNEIIAEAMEKTATLASFKAFTKGSLKLGGKTINGEFGMEAKIQAVQGEDRQDLQMAMETRLSPGDAVSTAYYKDGWYYTDDGKKKDKQQKPQDEVFGIIMDITDMVIDASGDIENIRVEEDGADKVYSYELPSFIAEDYIAKLLAQTGAEDMLPGHASVEVESLSLVSTVNKQGFVSRQKITASGKFKKAIVVVPVKAQMTADFEETDVQELKMELW